MGKLMIAVSDPYHVVIGENILQQIGFQLKQICHAEKVAIISDTNVWSLYGDTVLKSLCQQDVDLCHYIVPAGEQSKTMYTYFEILNFLAEHHLTRSDAIIALGGGTVGDLAGFVAATYLRGIPLIQVPTSLLAMVDSSVGGKTALDLPMGKNLVGSFYQPRLVLCDLGVLETLPMSLFRDGCAEIIKYGVLFDAQLFNHMLSYGLNFNKEYVVSRCVELKADVVTIDEFDRGERQKLNLGHTIGHALEALSNFTLTHGQAVAIGMATIVRSAYKHEYCSAETAEQILALLQKFGLPVHTDYSFADIASAASFDKKRHGNALNFIIPRHIGDCTIETIPINCLESFIEAGL